MALDAGLVAVVVLVVPLQDEAVLDLGEGEAPLPRARRQRARPRAVALADQRGQTGALVARKKLNKVVNGLKVQHSEA